MIFYNGRSSDDFRLVVEQYPARPIPKRKGERWSVPGRSGDVLEQADAWENVKRSYEVYLSAERPGLPRVAAKAAEWLMAPGYHVLWDEYDLDTFAMATFLGGVDVKNIDNAFGRFTLEFDCWPQRFLRSGAEAVSVPQGGSLVNPSIYPAEPLIVVQGSGSGALAIGGAVLTLDDCRNVTLDCRDEEAYRGVFNLNSAVRGSFPKLGPGETVVNWSGGVTGVSITPRWYVL